VKRPGRHFLRYLLLQVPGWLAIVVGGAVLVQIDAVGWGGVFAVLAGWMLKDLALYPLLRPHLFSTRGEPGVDLLGRTATVVTTLAPEGYVQLGNERWRARSEDGARVEIGRSVRVVEADGLTLTVAADVTPAAQ
jgi:membrane protein implicated in regulation of membrane protease activity